jgi:hypothetical protein
VILLSQRTNDRHLHVPRVPRRADNVEGTLGCGCEVEFPFSSSRSYYHAGNSVIRVEGVNQIAVGTIGQMLIAKNDFKCLRRKHFFALRSRRAYDHIGGQCFKSSQEGTTNLHVGRHKQSANALQRHGGTAICLTRKYWGRPTYSPE